MLKFGDLELWVVSDGVVHSDAGGFFGLVPRKLYQSEHSPSDDNLLPVTLNCLLVRSRGVTILIDTGLGDKLSPLESERWGLERPQGGLLSALEDCGTGPEDVQVVVNTHLHWDHCGGNTRRFGDRLAATFPRATYWVQRAEWADASHPDVRTRGTYLADNFAPLFESGQLKLLHGDTPITDQVSCVVTRGHTYGHQSVLLESGDWKGLYVADMASFASHMVHAAWLTAFDVEPLENLRTKQRWQQWALDTGAWLFFEHDLGNPIARLIRRGGRVEAEAVS
ncbi:MAG: MBL fold metallo-hydrolase [Chloroflexota bacterium]